MSELAAAPVTEATADVSACRSRCRAGCGSHGGRYPGLAAADGIADGVGEDLGEECVAVFVLAEYGHRRVHAVLVRGGERASSELARQLMREPDLEPCQPKPRRRSLTERDGRAAPVPDRVNRDFTEERPGQKLAGDITYSAQAGVMCWPAV